MNIDYYLPDFKLSNHQLAKEFPDWNFLDFEKKVGIQARHIAANDETALDLAQRACEKVFIDFDRNKIDFLLLCTQSPDYLIPTTACILQSRLNLKSEIGALDFNLGCSGYIYGLALAKGLLKSNVAKNVLFVVSETYSKHLNKNDKVNRSIFGDGAVATIVNSESFDIGQFVLGTNGKGYDNLIVKNSGFKKRSPSRSPEYEYTKGSFTSDDHLYMNGPEIYSFTLSTVPGLVLETAKKNILSMDEIDYFIFHQANEYMLKNLRNKIKIPEEKFCISFDQTGNTVSATIPIALKDSIDHGLIGSGSKVMLVGFGVGLSWGATIITL